MGKSKKQRAGRSVVLRLRVYASQSPFPMCCLELGDKKIAGTRGLGTRTPIPFHLTPFFAAKMRRCVWEQQRQAAGLLQTGNSQHSSPIFDLFCCSELTSSCFPCPKIPGGDTFLLCTQLGAQGIFPMSSSISCCFYTTLKTLSFNLAESGTWMLLERKRTQKPHWLLAIPPKHTIKSILQI